VAEWAPWRSVIEIGGGDGGGKTAPLRPSSRGVMSGTNWKLFARQPLHSHFIH